MSEFKTQRSPSIGSITGSAALLVALITMVMQLSSGAEAAPQAQHKVTAKQLAPGSVTAKALAPGAVGPKALRKSSVTSKALADNAVNKRVLAQGAVIARSISPDAVTREAIAPASVYGGALAAESIHMTPIADRDAVAENGMWTSSNTEAALCGPGEALLGTGFIFTEPGNKEVSFLRAAPFLSATTPSGVSGEISSNSGGTAKAEVMAICLGG
jgi:hypothetical protein